MVSRRMSFNRPTASVTTSILGGRTHASYSLGVGAPSEVVHNVNSKDGFVSWGDLFSKPPLGVAHQWSILSQERI